MTAPGGAPSAAIPAAPTAPAPEPPKPVDFVCEADVLAANREKRKIYIGPRTIVTPAARDAAAAADTLAMVER